MGIVRITAVVCLGVEAIFLSDLLIAEVLPRVLDHRGGPLVLLQLLTLSAPEGLFLSLPLAILIGTYLTLLRRREAGEFTVVAGMGHHAGLLIGGALGVGAAFFLFSTLLSAYAEPLSHYHRERIFVDMTFRALSNAEIGAGKFYSLEGLTVFATGGRLAQRGEDVFVSRTFEDGQQQLLLAERSEGVLDGSGAPLGLLLNDLTVVGYRVESADGVNQCDSCEAPLIAPSSFYSVNRHFVGLPPLQDPIQRNRTDNMSNNTSAELLLRLDREDARNVLGKRLLRAVLCLLAPLLALVAMTFTRPSTVLLALPAAAGPLLGASFFGPRLVDLLSPLPLFVSGCFTLAGLLAILAALQATIMRREASCFRAAKVNL